MSFGTWLFTVFNGELVGTDSFGNRYYRERSAAKGSRAKRWVRFKGRVESSKVPAEWHAWLHYTSAEPLSLDQSKGWHQEHLPNLTGTELAYLPPGHDAKGGKRERAAGDYQAWQPN